MRPTIRRASALLFLLALAACDSGPGELELGRYRVEVSGEIEREFDDRASFQTDDVGGEALVVVALTRPSGVRSVAFVAPASQLLRMGTSPIGTEDGSGVLLLYTDLAEDALFYTGSGGALTVTLAEPDRLAGTFSADLVDEERGAVVGTITGEFDAVRVELPAERP